VSLTFLDFAYVVYTKSSIKWQIWATVDSWIKEENSLGFAALNLSQL